MDDLAQFFCPNKKCSEYGLRGGENIYVRAWYPMTFIFQKRLPRFL